MSRLSTLLFVLAAGCAALTSGCATVIQGTTQAIPISSEPTGAQVSVDGKASGTTPTTLKLSRKHSHIVTLELAGYEVENVPVTNSMGGAVAGNILIGGLVGWGVDATTGSQYNLHPDTVSVRLRPKANTGVSAPVASSFAGEIERLDELHAAGKLSDEEYGKMRTALISHYSTPNSGSTTPSVTP